VLHFADFLKDQQIVKPQRLIHKPLVSVILPTYCRAHDGLLARAIKSVLSQTFSDFEFIIVDDGSTDGSEDIIRDFQKQDDRILYVRHEVNSGLPALRADEGILLSRGQYIAIQNDDDEWFKPFLQTVLRDAVAKNKRFVHCQAEWLMEGKVYRCPFPVMQPTYLSLVQNNKIANNSTLVHRSILRDIGLYDPHVILRRWTDWDLWLRVAREIGPYMVPEILVRGYGELPDSIGVRAPQIEYEDFMLLIAQLSRNTSLKFENIGDYDVVSLGRHSSVLPEDTIVSLHRNIVYPWLTQREEQLTNLGVSFEEITKVKQEIAVYSTGTEKTTSPKRNLSSGITGIRRPIGKLMHHFVPLLQVARVLQRFLCSIPVICKNLTRTQDDAYDALPLDFRRIKDDPMILNYRKRGFTLHRSCNLQDVPFLSYKISVKGGSVCAILLGLVVGELKPRGIVTVTAVSQRAQAAGYAMMPVSLIDPEKPVEFFFEPPLKAGRYYVIVLGKNLNAPAYVLELRKYRLIKKPFSSPVLA
jgi:glycosyltransferase involved in cell wall biosynthesis